MRDALEAEALTTQATHHPPESATPTGAATTNETNQAQSVTSTNQVPDTFNVMFELWELAAPNLDRESLEWFAGATGQAEYIASNLQDVVEGVGCLVAYDKEAGNFQSGDSFLSLMVSITNSLSNIRGLMLVGESASHRLRRPELFS